MRGKMLGRRWERGLCGMCGDVCMWAVVKVGTTKSFRRGLAVR